MLNVPTSHPFENVDGLGTAIRLFESSPQAHVGLVYKGANSEPRILHFAEHLDVRDDAPPSGNYRWAQIALNKPNRKVVAALCTALAKRVGDESFEVPYGFKYTGDYFTPTAEYVGVGIGNGLTCATFILAIFRTFDIELLKVDEWEARELSQEDFDFQRKQLDYLKSKYPKVAAAAGIHFGAPRYRPEEVVAGSICGQPPIGLKEAVRIGMKVLGALKKSYPGTIPSD